MKLFREPVSSPDQLFLLPLCVDDFVAKDASVRIISEAIDTLDCSVLYAKYLGMGAPSYDPKMMFKLLVFGYREGIRSSRRLDAACGHDMRFMFLAQMSRPDFRTLARFRRSNEKEIETLFVQTVLLCMKVGMVLLEHVAVDGTKIEANVSGRATFNSERLEKEIANIETKITTILKEAEETDALEDEKHGDSGADDPPDGLKTMNDRKKTLEAARDSLKETGHKSVAVTDTQSRLMKTRSGNRPAYNAQAVVDNAYQVIIAASVTQDTFDSKQFAPMLEQAIANTGDLPCQTSADKGYYSVAALEYCEKMGLVA